MRVLRTGASARRTSERDVVVEVAAALVATTTAATAARGRALVVVVRRVVLLAAAATAASTTAAVVAPTATAHAAAARVEHLHLVGDDFGGVAVVALFVLPLAGAQRPFDVHLRALLQVLAGDFTQASEQRHVVPLGAFLVLAGLLVLPVFAGGHANVGDRHPRGHGPGFRVCAQVADQDDFVDPPRHGFPFILKSGARLYGERRVS